MGARKVGTMNLGRFLAVGLGIITGQILGRMIGLDRVVAMNGR